MSLGVFLHVEIIAGTDIQVQAVRRDRMGQVQGQKCRLCLAYPWEGMLLSPQLSGGQKKNMINGFNWEGSNPPWLSLSVAMSVCSWIGAVC